MAWIESHQSLAQHPKTKRLARELDETIVTAVGRLQFLWWWALDYAQDGHLSKYEEYDIADAAMWKGDAHQFIEALQVSGFLDDDLYLHDWHEYAGKLIAQREKNAERKRRSRAQKEDVTGTSQGRPRDVHGSHTATVPNSTVPNLTKPNKHAAIAATISEFFPVGIGSGFEQDIFNYMDKGIEIELLRIAVKQATDPAIKSKGKYIVGTLRGYLNDGVTTIAQYEALEAQRQAAVSIKVSAKRTSHQVKPETQVANADERYAKFFKQMGDANGPRNDTG